MERRNLTGPGGGAAQACPEALNALETGVICCRLDAELTFLWGNAGFFRRIHTSREDFTARYGSLCGYYAGYPEDFALLQRELSQAEAGGSRAVRLTVRLPLAEGGFLWTQLSGSILDRPEGGPVLQAEFADVGALAAEREELDRLYRQKLQYFHWMMDTYVGNVYISDMETYELLYLNQSACEVMHRPACEMLGRKCYEVIQGRTSPCPFCTNDKLTEDAFYEWEFDNPVLERRFMIKNRVINWEGRRARIELSHDMQSAEYKLAKKDRERDALIQTVPGGFARMDARDMRTVLWYGGGFLDLIGYTEEQFEQELHRQCGYVHPEDIGRATAVMRSARDAGKQAVAESRIVTRDGAVKILTMTFSYVRGEDSWDGIPSFYSVGIDVTREREEQARQRRALEDAYQAARVASDAKTNFLSAMSHDIRTPMNAIMGMSVIAQANLDNQEKVRDCLGKISASSRHLLGLINEVLDMSKIESGRVDLSAEAVSLPQLMEDVMDICRPLVSQKRQELQMSADHVRHETVITDMGRMQQVLMNLLSNAVKYTPEGGTISLRLRERTSITPGRGQYEFIVTDNGIGMSEEFVRHIFEPFTRAEDSRISKTQGTGLGMTITENIVHMMNGTIEVKSRLGEGSQFVVALSLELGGEETYGEELAGLPVLVVDDDQVVCESATELLSELGMRGEWVLSGPEALERVVAAHDRGEDFFSVILDWQMPVMDGLETVKAIRRAVGRHTPIIVISAYDYSDIEAEFRQAGADDFLAKPLFKSRMAHTFHQFCQNGHPEPAKAPERAPAAFAGKRILLVEDNELNREIAAELLQMRGFLVDTAEDGRQAVETFRAAPPGRYCCILMDIQMPVMNGYQATEEIRALPRRDARSIPILALTANAFASDLGKSLMAGMNDHIAKPIDVDHLMDVLRRWIG
ncbi:response regulator [uncultured Oscillibacter sp.]|uniref:PAS domain-containing hybrid sensor histidine kinase/response regulator n=1 Tax=uncultured Oscillibacter sp. TaxID=876091 RepID=UPI0025D00058|nr:response regulator [uncultured Oscillibacter sp.]